MIVGLTGGIASGKTLVASYLQELGVPVIDTDEIARQVVAPGQPAWQCLYDWLGEAYFQSDGTLDRTALARRVFASTEERLRLEAITHPPIFGEVDRQVAELLSAPKPPTLIIVAVPLLFEVGAESHFDAVIVVWATPAQQRERLVTARSYQADEADARIAAQLPLQEKLLRADYRIDNSATPDATRRQVRALIQRLRAILPA